MSLAPQSEDRTIVQRTQLQPVDPKDSPGLWRRLLNCLQSLYDSTPWVLAKRYIEGRVRREEVEGEARLLEAHANFGRAMAEVQKMETESQGHLAKDLADARLTQRVADLLRAKETDTAEASENLRAIIRKIEFQGGKVEFGLSEPEGGEADEGDSGTPPK